MQPHFATISASAWLCVVWTLLIAVQVGAEEPLPQKQPPRRPEPHNAWTANFCQTAWQQPIALGDRRWTRDESENFVLYTCGLTRDEAVAVSRACEQCREELQAQWMPSRKTHTWQHKCTCVIHRTPESYDEALGNSDGASWGRAVVTRGRDSIAARRIDLCAPTPARLCENLAHEIAHMVLADHFPATHVPRWLDEGAAVLAEPHEKSAQRRTMEVESNPRLAFRAGEILMAEEYPTGPARHAFYNECHQLVAILLQRGDAPRLLAFAAEFAAGAEDAALRKHYGVANMLALDELRLQSLSPATTKAGPFVEASFSSRR